jgi:alkylation response protein AidB-like acyl-CoA dehydrogenase
MTSIAAEDLDALIGGLRRLLTDRCSEADVRRTMETRDGYDPALWRQLAEMGVLSVGIDEAFGGSGGGALELERIMEEVGGSLLCSPLISTVLTAGLLQGLGDEEANTRLLAHIADGSRIATVALAGMDGGWSDSDVSVEAIGADEAWMLQGTASFVTHAQIAAILLVVARTSDGLGVFEVDPTTVGLTIEPLPTFDHTLRLADIRFDGAAARRLTPARPVSEAVEAALDLALIALAGEQAGGAKRTLEFTLDYARTRIQFGRPIGGFQAIKHMAADLLLESESAISAARHAAVALANGDQDARAAVSLAAFVCADAFCTVTAAAIQMHGGVAFTWDHPAHLYLRRARADAQLFGSPDVHRERYLQAIGA